MTCAEGHPQSWVDERFGCWACGRRRGARVQRIADGSGGTGYRPDLARFPNDPEAFVSTTRGAQKLLDKRRRQGWGDPLPPQAALVEHPEPPAPDIRALVDEALAEQLPPEV